MMVFLIQTSKAESLMQCIEDAGYYHNVNPKLLYAIAVVESGLNPRAVNVNKDGSKDFGMFQINQWNLRKLGFTKKTAFDPCKSAYIAGYVLKQCVNRYGYTWKAIDCYNKGGRAKGLSRYVRKVLEVYRRLK